MKTFEDLDVIADFLTSIESPKQNVMVCSDTEYEEWDTFFKGLGSSGVQIQLSGEAKIWTLNVRYAAYEFIFVKLGELKNKFGV